MNTISPEKLEKLDVLYANGQFAGIAPGEFKYLQESDIDNLIFEAGQNLADTYQIPDKSTRESVDKLLDSGVMFLNLLNRKSQVENAGRSSESNHNV